MSWFVVDVEADGQVPGLYSMVSFGAVLVDENLDKTFYGETKPITEMWDEQALSISGISREEHENFDDPQMVIIDFERWLKETSKGRPVMLSDNIAFDWQFINYYFHRYLGRNPFGYSGRRIGDMYCGMVKDSFAKWKHLRTTKHTHHPVDDAKGNAEAILKMKEMGLKIPRK
jgi:DNA polymerase III epsilon subunit-like protein